MRPKIERYGQDVQLIIVRTARYDDEAEGDDVGEISVFLAPTFVIAVRQGVASELSGARQRLEQRPELPRREACPYCGQSWIRWWTILRPVVAGLDNDIDQIEATVFSGAVAPTERIYSLRREASGFYRAVHPLLGVSARVERAAEARQLQPYLRDVQDHLLLVDEEVAAQRDLLGTVLEANMAVISVDQTEVGVRQNATIEQLTILATIFLPLTFVTGFLGQNFGWLVRHITGLGASSATESEDWQYRWRCCSCGFDCEPLAPGSLPRRPGTAPDAADGSANTPATGGTTSMVPPRARSHLAGGSGHEDRPRG